MFWVFSLALSCDMCAVATATDGFYGQVDQACGAAGRCWKINRNCTGGAWGVVVTPGTVQSNQNLEYYVQPGVEPGALPRRLFDSPWFAAVTGLGFDSATRVVTVSAQIYACPEMPATALMMEPDFTIVGAEFGTSDVDPGVAVALGSTVLVLAFIVGLCVCRCPVLARTKKTPPPHFL